MLLEPEKICQHRIEIYLLMHVHGGELILSFEHEWPSNSSQIKSLTWALIQKQ